MRIVVHRVRAALAPTRVIESRNGGYALALRRLHEASGAPLHGGGAAPVAKLYDRASTEFSDHPLTRFTDVGEAPTVPRMVIPGFLQAGVVVIAGAHGAGKTTALVPLALIAAGVHASGDPLTPRHWRHVVYIAEDEAQVQRIVHGIVAHSGLGIDLADMRQRFHLVPALRLPPEDVAKAGPIYRRRLTRMAERVELPPLVVIDTRSATIDAADENDNAEAGRIVAMFKQQFAGLPVWMVGHVAKALTTRKDLQGLSARGASAIEADAHKTELLVVETDGRRFLVLRRVAARCPLGCSGVLAQAHRVRPGRHGPRAGQ